MSSQEEAWTVGRLLTWTIDYLRKQGVDNPRLDAEVLLAHARGCRRIDLYATYSDLADDGTRATFRELVRRRAAGEPVAYLVGHREFYALDFEVTPDVLIPRPETELLVVALLDHVKQRRAGDEALRIADVGTGSGILAVCVAKYASKALVTAIDISPAALDVARRNAVRHGVAERIQFVEGDLFSNLPGSMRFDYVVSNPPYVAAAEMINLAPDVRDHEPKTALLAGDRGTEIIERLLNQVPSRLNPAGSLLIEVSPMIAAEVEELVRNASALLLRPTIRDLAGHPRVVQATASEPRDP